MANAYEPFTMYYNDLQKQNAKRVETSHGKSIDEPFTMYYNDLQKENAERVETIGVLVFKLE